MLEAGSQGVHSAFEEKIIGEEILGKKGWFGHFNFFGRKIQQMESFVVEKQCNQGCCEALT